MRPRTNATTTQAGILRPDEFARHVAIERTAPAPELARWVDNHWTLAWDLPDGTTFPSAVIPHPACNLTVEDGAARAEADGERVLVTGVTTRRFEVEVRGRGWVHGVKLRPGGLVALLGEQAPDARTLTDRTLPARALLPVGVHDALDALRPGTPAAEATAAVSSALAAIAPETVDPAYERVLDVVATMLADRTLLRVDQVTERCGVARRTLERLFARYVGVGPKWVLARYRVHDVVTALDAGWDGSLADLAAAYGWFDQAHFGRDFTALVGMAPSDYRDRQRSHS